MPTIPTGKLERELKRLYMQWVHRLPENKDNLHNYVEKFRKSSIKLVDKMGGDIARLGVPADFPAPKTLDLSLRTGTIYQDMELAAIQAQIGTGLNPQDTARALQRAGVDKSYRRLERLARTETVSAYWKNSWDSIEGLGLVMVWGAENGPRTCQWCLERDGLVMESSDLRDHPNGRCTPLPTHPSQVEYRGSVRADGQIYQDPAWSKANQKPKVEEVVTPYDESQFGVEWPAVSIGDKSARVGNSGAVERMVDSVLSEAEKEAVRKYSSGEYFFDIRDAYKANAPYMLDDGTDLFTALHTAMQKSTLDVDTKLYRAMQVSPDWLDGVTPGSSILHDFFISTTADNGQAQSYGKQKGKRGQKPVLLEILAPKGTKAVPGMAEIQELVLSPDSVMRVTRKTELTKYTYITVELR